MEIARFPPRAKSKTRLICVVAGCNSTYSKNLELRFHNFPPAGKRFVWVENGFGKKEKIDQLAAWMKACRLKRINCGMKVCSLHFRKSDYILPDVVAKRRYLKTNVVPSCNLPNSDSTEARDARRRKKARRSAKQIESQQISEVKESVCSQRENDVAIKREDLEPTTAIIAGQPAVVKSEPVSTENVDLQARADFPAPKLMDFISSDAELSALTGIESLAIFDTIVEIARETHGSRPENDDNPMNIRDKVLLTYVKLKQNMSYDCLAIFARCRSAKACERIFFDTVRDLSVRLKSFVRWPQGETVWRSVPRGFEGFEDVRVILDCTEIAVGEGEKSETCKFLTGVTPAGNVSYLSRAFGGRTSAKAIFDGCDIKGLLRPGDAVMVDVGLAIDDKSIGDWKCYRLSPPTGKRQFTKSATISTPETAEPRIRVERLHRRIKKFEIVKATMPASLFAIVEDIFLVICATLNLNSPTMELGKFEPS